MIMEVENRAVCGKYELWGDKPIGEGCWGEIWKALDVEKNKLVAIKILNPNEIARKQMKERGLTLREILIKEGNIPKTADWGIVPPPKIRRTREITPCCWRLCSSNPCLVCNWSRRKHSYQDL